MSDMLIITQTAAPPLNDPGRIRITIIIIVVVVNVLLFLRCSTLLWRTKYKQEDARTPAAAPSSVNRVEERRNQRCSCSCLIADLSSSHWHAQEWHGSRSSTGTSADYVSEGAVVGLSWVWNFIGKSVNWMEYKLSGLCLPLIKWCSMVITTFAKCN